ncbi:MAG: RNase adapter RapZ [Actinomycetota bacterium]|nr:RNase adapter RapZ [Actinomycetota bacterium]
MNIKKEKIKSGMDIVIITGLSGAGKTEALNYFEDAGYYCIDNLPAHLLLDIIKYFSMKNRNINNAAFAIDLRSGYFFKEIYKTLDELKKRKIDYRILFLEAAKSAIIKRYSLTRRKHPLVEDGNIANGVEEEIEKMGRLREIADVVIDTSLLNSKELRVAITDRMMSNTEKSKLMQISVNSFGYKYGVPESMDIVMDVRFIPNPFYNDELKDLNGKDDKVIKSVLNSNETRKFMNIFEKLLDFLVPNYIAEGKSYLAIGIGCTGGKHRSVVISDKLYEYLKVSGYSIKIYHRDIGKE